MKRTHSFITLFSLFFNLVLANQPGLKFNIFAATNFEPDTSCSIIVVYIKQKNGTITETGEEAFLVMHDKSENKKALLGCGRYEIIFNSDTASFNESWKPAKGNVIEEFKGENISTARWIDHVHLTATPVVMTYHDMLLKRFTARLIESIVESGLVNLGFDKGEVKKDILVLDTGNILDGKFSCFSNRQVMEKYIKGWRGRTPTSPHKSIKAYNSPEILRAGVVISLYDGKKDSLDNYPPHIGLVRKGFLHHCFETIPCYLPFRKGCSLTLDNANRVRKRMNSEK